MPLNPLNHHYAIENPSSVYDEESMTALELAGRTTAKVNETVEAFNELEKETNQHLDTQDETIAQRLDNQDNTITQRMDNQDNTIAQRLGNQDERLTAMENTQIPNTVTTEIQAHIDNGVFDASIDRHAGNLSDRVDNLLGSMTEGSTTGDAELIDGRTNERGQAHTVIGGAIRRNASNIAEIEDIFEYGLNLVDNNNVDKGFVNQVNGEFIPQPDMICSQYVKVKSNTLYTFTCIGLEEFAEFLPNTRVCFYDCDKNYISGFWYAETQENKVVTPDNTYYCRLCNGKNTYLVIYEGDMPIAKYYKHSKKIKESYLPLNKSVIDNSIQPTINLACEANFIKQCYVNQVYGNLHLYSEGVANNAQYFNCYHLIPVKPNTVYRIGLLYGDNWTENFANTRVAFYEEDKTFISGIMGSETQYITTPSYTSYISISFMSYLKLMLVEGDFLPDYEPYKGYIHPGFIDGYTKAEIDEILTATPPSINLPSKVYGLVGEELNIYFDNLVDGKDTDYTFDVVCDVGMHLDRCYRITPTTDNVGSHTLKISATNRMGATTTKTVCLTIAPETAGSGSTKSVIVLGDSTTASGMSVSKLNENFNDDLMNINTIGTLGSGANKHEGRSGWKYDFYFNMSGIGENTNPFYNPDTQSFDAQYYFNNSGVAIPDYFIINLGINDTFYSSSEETLTQLNTWSDAMIDSIRSACPNTKICVALTIPPNYSQDPFGKDYGSSQTRSGYKHNNHVYVQNLISRYDGRESENIYVIPIHTNLDTVYNMTSEEIQVNKRNPKTYASPQAHGGVHPDTYGYWQIADAYWFFIKNMEV